METAERTTLIGKVLAGKYRLLEKLSQGGMGYVYAAEHIHLEEPRAIKILRGEAHDVKNRKRFLNEIKLTHRISKRNEHIVSIHDDFGFEDGIGYFVMEFLQGDLLAERIARRKGSLSIDWCLRVAAQICDAMATAHEEGVIHRDLKPENIFLIEHQGQRDFVKIVDFGIARVPQHGTRLTEAGYLIGTPLYMAPEQITGPTSKAHKNKEAYLDGRCDIYALGCILFEMLTGSTPFGDESQLQTPLSRNKLLLAHVQEPPPSLRALRPEVSEGLEAVVHKALAKKPEDRFDTMEDFALALLRHVEGEQPAESGDVEGQHTLEMFRKWSLYHMTAVSTDEAAALFHEAPKAPVDSTHSYARKAVASPEAEPPPSPSAPGSGSPSGGSPSSASHSSRNPSWEMTSPPELAELSQPRRTSRGASSGGSRLRWVFAAFVLLGGGVALLSPLRLQLPGWPWPSQAPAGTADAGSSPTALRPRAHHKRQAPGLQAGLRAYRRGQYRRAIGLWKKAPKARSSAEIALHLGHAYSRLGHLLQARRHYRRFMAKSEGGHPQRPQVNRRLTRIEAALIRRRLRTKRLRQQLKRQLQKGRYGKAHATLSRFLDEAPRLATVYLELAGALAPHFPRRALELCQSRGSQLATSRQARARMRQMKKHLGRRIARQDKQIKRAFHKLAKKLGAKAPAALHGDFLGLLRPRWLASPKHDAALRGLLRQVVIQQPKQAARWLRSYASRFKALAQRGLTHWLPASVAARASFDVEAQIALLPRLQKTTATLKRGDAALAKARLDEGRALYAKALALWSTHQSQDAWGWGQALDAKLQQVRRQIKGLKWAKFTLLGAQTQLGLGNFAKARALYRRFLEHLKGTPAAAVWSQRIRRVEQKMKAAQAHLSQARKAQSKGKWKQVIAHLEAYRKAFPQSERRRAIEKRLEQARCRSGIKRFCSPPSRR